MGRNPRGANLQFLWQGALVALGLAALRVRPIIENVHFRPGGESDLVPHLPDSCRRLMIQNGTLREDGTANRETAARLGWNLAGEDLRSAKAAETSRE